MRHNLLVRDHSASLANFLWLAVIVVALALLGYSAALRHQAGVLHANVTATAIRVASLSREAAQTDIRVAPFRQAAKIAAELGREAIDPGLLRRLENGVPDDVWFTGVTLSRDTMGIDGRSLALADIAQTVTAMRGILGIASADVTVVTKSAEGWYTFHVVAEPQIKDQRSTP